MCQLTYAQLRYIEQKIDDVDLGRSRHLNWNIVVLSNGTSKCLFVLTNSHSEVDGTSNCSLVESPTKKHQVNWCSDTLDYEQLNNECSRVRVEMAIKYRQFDGKFL